MREARISKHFIYWIFYCNFMSRNWIKPVDDYMMVFRKGGTQPFSKWQMHIMNMTSNQAATWLEMSKMWLRDFQHNIRVDKRLRLSIWFWIFGAKRIVTSNLWYSFCWFNPILCKESNFFNVVINCKLTKAYGHLAVLLRETTCAFCHMPRLQTLTNCLDFDLLHLM